MLSFVWLILALFVAWIVIVAVITTLLVKSGKFKLKKGGAPGRAPRAASTRARRSRPQGPAAARRA